MTGPLVAYLLLFIAFLLSVPAASAEGLTTWGSLAAASVAFVAMGLNQLFAARPKFLEGAFGGLDRMYYMHRTMGRIAFALILVHYFITPNFKGQTLTAGLNSMAKDAANIGFWGLIILIGFSLIKKIPFTRFEVPYHIWRQSHRFIGVFFMVIVFHQAFIKRPFDGTALLANYLNLFAFIGIASFLYTQLGPFLRRRRYEVTAVEKAGGATLISAKPVGRPLKSEAGQFAIIKFSREGLGEPHPFTIAGRDEDGGVSFAIKASGDFTRRLHEKLEVGDRMAVEGGYGRFKFEPKNSRQLWLAGGIGITPFLAMAQKLDSGLQQDVCLFHCVRNDTEAIDRALLEKKAGEVERFSYVLYASDDAGRLDAEKLRDLTSIELDGAALMFCGPPPLRLAIVNGLKGLGKKFSAMKFELFEFR